MLAASGAFALGLGLATGVGADALTTAADAEAAPQGPPATCAEAKAAWARSASAQVRLSVEDPATLRRGFGAAHDALAGVVPPPRVAADWTAVQDYLSAVVTAIKGSAGAEGDDQVAVVVAETLSDLDTPAMTDASERVTRFLADDCGAGATD